MGRPLLLTLSALASLALPLGLGATVQPVGAQATASVAAAAAPAAAEPDPRSFMGVWALTDHQNNLFNVRLYPGGKAVSTVGTSGVPPAGAQRLTDAQLRQLGRWVPWGTGIRVNYNDGWTDWLYMGPAGLSHASWQPGQSRGSLPANYGTAVKLGGVAAQVVGVYSFPPAQQDLKPYTATLLSNGQAFNDIDNRAGGVWKLINSTVVIDWISGWRSTLSLEPATPLQLRHWAPGSDRSGPPSGGVRQAKLIQ